MARVAKQVLDQRRREFQSTYNHQLLGHVYISKLVVPHGTRRGFQLMTINLKNGFRVSLFKF